MKRYDLNPAPDMTPVIGLLHATIDYNYRRLLRLVQGTEDLIDYKGPDVDLNSIAQLLRHMAVVDMHWVYRLQSKEVPGEVLQKFGPMYDEEGKLPAVRDVPLHILLAEYDDVQRQLKQVCARLVDSDLEKTVPFENGNTASIRWAIWHIADHSRHHYANIAHLKKVYASHSIHHNGRRETK